MFFKSQSKPFCLGFVCDLKPNKNTERTQMILLNEREAELSIQALAAELSRAKERINTLQATVDEQEETLKYYEPGLSEVTASLKESDAKLLAIQNTLGDFSFERKGELVGGIGSLFADLLAILNGGEL